jgi:hypothetical protein
MNNFIEQVIEETFVSKRQSELTMKNNSIAKPKKKEKKEQKLSDEVHNGQIDEKTKKIQQPSSHDKGNTKVYPTRPTPWSKSVKKPTRKEVEEIVDADGNIQTGDEPGNPNAYIRSKKTTDQVAKATMGQMGSFGVLGGATGANKTLKYWAEADMSKALGNEIKNDSDKDLEDATEYFEKDLEVGDEDEAKERAKQMGFDGNLPDGQIRLVEDPRKYIEEYLAKKGRDGELVKKHPIESTKKVITPIIRRQLGSMKQALKSNNLTVSDITEYLEDNGE